MIPQGLTPGRYVLQWRWDCEESDQIWASCSDGACAAPVPMHVHVPVCMVWCVLQLPHKHACT